MPKRVDFASSRYHLLSLANTFPVPLDIYGSSLMKQSPNVSLKSLWQIKSNDISCFNSLLWHLLSYMFVSLLDVMELSQVNKCFIVGHSTKTVFGSKKCTIWFLPFIDIERKFSHSQSPFWGMFYAFEIFAPQNFKTQVLLLKIERL